MADPTPKQHAFARKLEAKLTHEQQQTVRGDVFGRKPVWGTNPPVWAPDPHPTVTRESFSRYIDALIVATGGESKPFVPRSRAQRYGRRRIDLSKGAGFRCTHEDYPCCGCGNYADTGMTAY